MSEYFKYNILMKNIYLTLLISCISLSVFAKNQHFDKLQLNSGVNLDVVEAKDLKARVFGYQLTIKVKDKIDENLELFFGASAVLETGSNDVIGTVAEFEPNESVNLDEGGIEYSPADSFSIKLGALNQGSFYSPLLVAPNAFAAVEEKLTLGFLYFKAQQAIPSNNKLTKRIGTIETGTPQFTTETLGLILGKKHIFKTEISHFYFQDLSSNIAEKSNTLGNSITGIGDGTKFNYLFEGYNVLLQGRFKFGNNAVIYGGEYLYNNQAPAKRNTGTLAMLGFKRNSWKVMGEVFSNESDTAPAFYNSKYYGHNNMAGSAAVFKVKNKSFDLRIRYAQFSPIEENNLQTKTEIFSFNLSKKYDF